jgi:hypothetical protein
MRHLLTGELVTLTEIAQRTGSSRSRVVRAVGRLNITPALIAGWVGLYPADVIPRVLAEIDRAGNRGSGKTAARCREVRREPH